MEFSVFSECNKIFESEFKGTPIIDSQVAALSTRCSQHLTNLMRESGVKIEVAFIRDSRAANDVALLDVFVNNVSISGWSKRSFKQIRKAVRDKREAFIPISDIVKDVSIKVSTTDTGGIFMTDVIVMTEPISPVDHIDIKMNIN